MGDGLDLLKRGPNYVIHLNMVRICVCLPLLIILIVLFNIFHFPPSFQLKRLYIPALDKSLNTSTNATITFHFSLRNSEQYSNIYYDPIKVTFYENPNHNHSIANFTIPEFYQTSSSEVDYSGTVNATGLDLEAAKREIAADGFKIFHVGLKTSLRYDLYGFWKTGRSGYRSGVDVKIGDTGAANSAQEISIWARVTLVGLVIMFLSTDIFHANYGLIQI
ncbi:NON RACE-SPECIFIC DISEASE RESISTANCE 1 family protein [Rhynchospora pubera]|uniref:NON RACE-SPECIFIC DISEASE RESISTANCE 1 family protein n=1 Tax=Rhynchospora pubera TaxID=906938 RepID=A0AAV8C9X6_9POAL|nr:NON RACE-SPECIFIC DISEASE RESISTANCE 1 family protein [Rhynchospora pubera]